MTGRRPSARAGHDGRGPGLDTAVDPDEERAVVARLRAGDTAAFDAVFDAFRSRLFGYLAWLAPSRDVAEDLLQEAWLRFARMSPRLRDDTRLGPLLFTIARNLLLNYRRSRMLDVTRTHDLGTLQWPAPPRSPFDELAAGEQARALDAALSSLALSDREALLLVAVEGLPPSEAASVCQLRPEAFRKRLQRARERLARALDRGRPPSAAALPNTEARR